MEADFDYVTGQFDTYTVAATGSSGNAITISGGATYGVTSANAGTAVAVANATNTNDIDVASATRRCARSRWRRRPAAAEVAATATASGGLTAANFVTDTVIRLRRQRGHRHDHR